MALASFKFSYITARGGTLVYIRKGATSYKKRPLMGMTLTSGLFTYFTYSL